MQVKFVMPKSINDEIEKYGKVINRAKVHARNNSDVFSADLVERIENMPIDTLVVKVEKIDEITVEQVIVLKNGEEEVRIGSNRYKVKDHVLDLQTGNYEISLSSETPIPLLGYRLQNLFVRDGFIVTVLKHGENLFFPDQDMARDYLFKLKSLADAIEKAEAEVTELMDEEPDEEEPEELNLDPNGRPKRKLFRPTFAGKS